MRGKVGRNRMSLSKPDASTIAIPTMCITDLSCNFKLVHSMPYQQKVKFAILTSDFNDTWLAHTAYKIQWQKI